MLKIGDKIKSLRKKQDITQEKLAGYLNISYQAVSKWENGTAFPDITLLPKIAKFFNISTDELLCINDEENNIELSAYEEKYNELSRNGKVLEKIKLSREVLDIHPKNYQWMLNLAYALIQYCATNEQVLYSNNNGFEEEAIAICERILDDCTNDSIRHSAIQILCYTYPKHNQTEKAIELANKMPDIILCREALLSHVYHGEEQIKQLQNNLLNMTDMCAGILFELSSFKTTKTQSDIDEKIQFIEAAVILYQTLLQGDENSLFFNIRLSVYYENLSSLWCLKKNAEKAIKYIRLAVKCAVDYDKCRDRGEQKYKSIFANRCTFNPKNSGTNMDCTMTESILSSTEKSAYDLIRKTEEFKEIQEVLKNKLF